MMKDLKQVLGGLVRFTAKLVTLPVRIWWGRRRRRKEAERVASQVAKAE